MPSTCVWKSGAAAVNQVQTYTFAGTWTNTDVITIVIGAKSWSFVTGSATIATFLTALQTAFANLDTSVYPEFGTVTMTNPTGSTITLTANTAGQPLASTFSTNSASGTIGGASSSTGSTTTASSGPYDWSTAANWSTNTVPATGDTAIIDLDGAIISFGLDQHTVTLASLQFLARTCAIGLNRVNNLGYPEFLPNYLKIGATACTINSEQTSQIKVDFYTVQTTCNVLNSGQAINEVPAILLCGTNASNVFNITKGQVGFAFFGGDLLTFATCTQGSQGGGISDSSIIMGLGTTIGTITKSSGTTTINTAIGTAFTQLAGTATIWGSGSVAGLAVEGGNVIYNTTGALGTGTTVSGSGILDFSQDTRAKTITGGPGVITCHGDSAQVLDPNGVIGRPWVFVRKLGRAIVDPGPNVQMTIDVAP